MRVLVTYPASPSIRDSLARAFPQIEFAFEAERDAAAMLSQADVFFGHPAVPMPWKEALAGGLRWLHSSAAGVDRFLVQEILASDIPLTSTSGVLGSQVAEQGMLLLLSLLRSSEISLRQQQQGLWQRHPCDVVSGKRCTIVGGGSVGSALARRLIALEATVRVTDAYPLPAPAEGVSVHAASELDDLLPSTDVLLLAAPLTPATRDMITAERLSQLPRPAWLINVARGELVREPDLLAALTSGHLKGAGLDVLRQEPLPATSPLWQVPNLLISPHVGAVSPRRDRQTAGLFAANLQRLLQKQPLLNRVTKSLGLVLPEHRLPPGFRPEDALPD